MSGAMAPPLTLLLSSDAAAPMLLAALLRMLPGILTALLLPLAPAVAALMAEVGLPDGGNAAVDAASDEPARA